MRVPFYINFTHPFKLSDYLLPNRTDWLIQNDRIVSNYKDMNLIYVFCASKEYGYSLYKDNIPYNLSQSPPGLHLPSAI